MNNNQNAGYQISLPENIDLGQLANYKGEELKQYVGNTIYQTILQRYGEKTSAVAVQL